jgi:hypothetical protein
MATIRVDVDIDLDEFDLDDLLEEIEDRYNSKSKKNKKEIEDWANDVFKIESFTNIRLSLLDQMKIDFLMHNLDKITLNNLENLI